MTKELHSGYARLTSFGIPEPDTPEGLAWHLREKYLDIEDLDEWERVVMLRDGVIEARNNIYYLIKLKYHA